MGSASVTLVHDAVATQELTDEFYSSIMDKDNITSDWILFRTPVPMLSVVLVYLLVILKIGPWFMEGRRPYQLTTVLRVYNIFQVFANIFFFYPVLAHIQDIPYIIKLSCRIPSDSYENLDSLRQAYLYFIWVFFVLKIVDLLDTVFMVLRKKNSHITFLHVYHHVCMVVFTWVTATYIKANQAAIPGFINICVHIVMYTYYFLATFGPTVQKYLWWKQHLTKLQLAQFVFILVYLFVLYYNDCPISRAFTYIWLFNVFVIFCLFIDFYVKSYIVKSAVTPEKPKTS